MHPGPGPGEDYRAVAPYGLVPLPERPMPAETLHARLQQEGVTQRDLLRSHDSRIPGTHTGWIDVDIHALTPLFLGTAGEDGKENRPFVINEAPAVPGSALRGLVRNQLRLLTGGETGPVNTPQLFFRAPVSSADNPRSRTVMQELHRLYRDERHGTPPSLPSNPMPAGFLRHEDGKWRIYPIATERPLKIQLEHLKEDFEECFSDLPPFPLPPEPGQENEEKRENYIPAEYHREFQHLKVTALCPEIDVPKKNATYEYNYWAMAVLPEGEAMEEGDEEAVRQRLDHRWKNRKSQDFRRALEENRHEAAPIRELTCVLVLTGVAAGGRKNAYLFPDEGAGAPLDVPDDLVALMESASQVTQFQERNFPNDEDVAVGRADPGRPAVRDNKYGSFARNTPEPVWYRTDDSGRVVSFGRSGGYRVAVGDTETTPIERAVPAAVLSPQHAKNHAPGRAVDVPRALFGDIDLFGAEERVTAARGRISFGSAVSTGGAPEYPHPLRVELLNPGRLCFANYVVQPARNKWGTRPDLLTWAHEDDIRLGGYKVYLHRYDGDQRFRDMSPSEDRKGDTERDIRPIDKGAGFSGRITFTNLTSAELGGLLRALLLGNPPGGGDQHNPTHAHKIGMGKALGLGSVHIRPRLYLVAPEARFESLDPDAGIRAADRTEVSDHLAAFDGALTEWERSEAVRLRRAGPDDWRSIARVEALLLATQWRDRLPWECTRPMDLKEYALYPVLPTIQERFSYCEAHRRPS
ncbi:TIGR03986 family type III CRISPR-associated RAMP protein [Lipingzhangella halophila]|uniref:TIGR03986 family type III CRISPR-associated RAMP protein n=1 Tax=Lipingzhangella halophila TaxID=1783352 RepID=UPI0028A80BED|nr:TIGR03986 family CRISPR-associated RAMP protein [Lipingzhangella halophila]